MPGEALGPARAAWTMKPSSERFLAEYLRALRDLGLYREALAEEVYVRGGGVCRYYLADCERITGPVHGDSWNYLLSTSSRGDDSAAADASAWLAILYRNEGDPGAAVSMARRAVALRPDDSFYRCLLAGMLADSGCVEEAGELLRRLRLRGYTGYSYWRAMAGLAKAENDTRRRVWAFSRALELRDCPESRRNLGWALFGYGLEALREGNTVLCAERMDMIPELGDSSELFVRKADSVSKLIRELENRAAGGR